MLHMEAAMIWIDPKDKPRTENKMRIEAFVKGLQVPATKKNDMNQFIVRRFVHGRKQQNQFCSFCFK